MHACGQFQILVTKLRRLIDGLKGDKDMENIVHEQRLGNIVEHHLHILG